MSWRCSPFLFSIVLVAAGCVSTGKLKDGETAWRLGQYAVAVEMLQEEYAGTRNPVTKAQIAFRLGQSYDALNKPDRSADWFGKAWSEGYGADALYARAQQYKKQEAYDRAIADLNSFLKAAPELRPSINREIAACRRAIDWKEGTHYYTVSNLTALNSPAEDFSPVFFEGGKLVFTSGRASATGDEPSPWSGGQFFDLFQATPAANGTDFGSPEPFDIVVNSDFYEGAATFSADFSEMVYTQCGTPDQRIDDPCRLLYRYREPDGSWGAPEELRFFADSVNVGHPALAPDGKRLWFSAAGDPEGYGGADLYYVRLTDAGWGSPINLGPTINTKGNEVFPYQHADGSIYFASDGHAGMGGLDLYRTEENRKRFRRPVNLGYPMNSGADDFGIVLVDEETLGGDKLAMGFFSSTRPGGRGSDDLYRFVLVEAPPPPPLYVLRGDIVTPVLEDPKDPASAVTGYRALPDARVQIFNASAGDVDLGYLDLDLDARFETELEFGTDYELVGSFDKFLTGRADASTSDLPSTPGDTFYVDARIILDPIRKGQVKLENIYYDFDSFSLRPSSFEELNKLVDLLQLNPTLEVEIGSHTDAQGTDEYNDNLSQNRAQSVVDYLIDKGVRKERLIAVGYGETMLVNHCRNGVVCSDDEHQENRRTTFKVTGEIELESAQPDEIDTDPRRRRGGGR